MDAFDSVPRKICNPLFNGPSAAPATAMEPDSATSPAMPATPNSMSATARGCLRAASVRVSKSPSYFVADEMRLSCVIEATNFMAFKGEYDNAGFASVECVTIRHSSFPILRERRQTAFLGRGLMPFLFPFPAEARM
ncbi:hypothetical protein [Acetobacter fabarum]|uniref:hypothetical protein n=1 Tax=Acetobacter fabarum TaxID=483199 RepID=UPI00209E2B69|nr:hypothetical protein [Acetobacter fabarum]MCP1227951.1 hypothetical protein [Acetobacter fabarum]MCP1233448.1 hypothetical protein [Acetobacter fabarum]